jgi:hypothetical protein
MINKIIVNNVIMGAAGNRDPKVWTAVATANIPKDRIMIV